MKPPNCTGSPETCLHCRAILTMPTAEYVRLLRRETREMFAAAGHTPPPEAVLESADELPNGYAVALSARASERAAVIADPTYWPTADGSMTYQPHGNPPDGYALHLAIRHLDAEDAKEKNR